MSSTIQISAVISADTKDRMERYVRATGTARAHLIEQALLHHLRALEELPGDALIPARIVLTQPSAERIRALTTHPPEPTPAMRRLFHDR